MIKKRVPLESSFQSCDPTKTIKKPTSNNIVVHRWRCRANSLFIILHPNAQGGRLVNFECPCVIKKRLFPSLELMKYASPSGKSSKKLQTH